MPRKVKLDPQAVATTAAYLFQGFNAHEHARKTIDSLKNDLIGEDGVIDNIAAFALRCEERWLKVDADEWGGMWLYEVVEPFGAWLAEYAHEHGHLPYGPEVNTKLEALITEAND